MTALETHEVPADVDASEWDLRVTGTVDPSQLFTRADLLEMPLERFTDDFECREGWTATDLSWRGVRVERLLDRVDPSADASFGLVRSQESGYACSYSLERLAQSVLALELDGDDLPVVHGGPARLVFPDSDRECWETVKWVAEIELLTAEPDEGDTARTIALSRLDE
jgi:DMSO/TMAO reductase YedYZ molybdopterin-dependent catalytic subunit